MITLPFKMPSAPDWDIDWEEICSSPIGGFLKDLCFARQVPIGHDKNDALAHARFACEALVRDPVFREYDSESRAGMFLAALLLDVGKIAKMRFDDVATGSSIRGARIVRKFLWQTLDLAGTEEKRCLREMVCALICFHSLPLYFLSKLNPAHFIGSIAAEGCIIKGFTLAKLVTLVRGDVVRHKTNDTGLLLNELSLFISIAKDMGCLHMPPRFGDSFSRFAWLDGRTDFPEQRLSDDTWGKVYMMCGLPGTGKDTWIHNNLPDIPMISLDKIREERGISWDDDQQPVHALAFERARELLRKKQSFVWNATSLTRNLRKRELKLFRDYGAYTEIVVLETSWKEEMRRNSGRKKVVPEDVIDTMLGRLIPPSVKEAHDVSCVCC